MVRNYVRKTVQKYTLETLKQAVDEVKSGVVTSYQASKKYKIPRTTITDRIKLRRGVVKDTRGRPTTIDTENEVRLANGLRVMEKYGVGLSLKETAIIVSKFVTQNKIKNYFKANTPGYDWFSGFMKRNKLSLKKPQQVEMSRKIACDPFIIDEYFEILGSCIKKLNLEFKPENIWNLDESSFSKDPEKTKVVGARGYASTRTTATSGKDNVTVLFTVSASGEKLAPLIIYRGQYIWDQWISQKAYDNTQYAATKRGWIESKVFEKYMINTVLPHLSKNGPSLLIFDGHSTHIQLSIIEKAIELDVTILKLPAHASHLLQPLDLAVFKSMKDKWDKKLLSFQRLNVGSKLLKSKFAELLGEVWAELDPNIIRNGFRKGGVCPFNRNVVPDEKYDPVSLQRFKEAKRQGITFTRDQHLHQPIPIQLPIPTLSILCLKVINDNIGKSIHIKWNQNNSVINYLRPSEVIIPCASHSKGTSGIQILENRIVNNFENLLLQTIKKPNQAPKLKRTRLAKGCEIITYETYKEKLKSEEAAKMEKEQEKTRKALKKSLQNDNSNKNTQNPTVSTKTKTNKKKKHIKRNKKTKNRQNWSPETTEDEMDIPSSLSDDELKDWDSFREFINNNCSDDDIDNISLNGFNASALYDSNMLNVKTQTCEVSDIRRPEVDDWLIVKFATKKTVKHFIGNVISINDNIKKLKFLRKTKNSKIECFHYPDVEDILELKHDSDIVKFLDKPTITRRGQFIFKEHFKEFNIQ